MSLTAGTASASCTRLGERTVEPPIAIAKCSKLCASTQMTINPDTKPSSPSSSISSILQPRPRTAIGLSALDHRGRPLIGHHKPSPNHWPKTLTLRAGPHNLLKPWFNTIGEKIVSRRTLARERAVFSTTLVGSGLFPCRRGCRRNFPDVRRQSDADRLEDATDVTGHRGAQEELLSLLFGLDLLQPVELANELTPFRFQARSGEMLFQDFA